jgi:Rrf2 family protein
MVELARQTGHDRIKSEALARTLDIPERFLGNILPDLSRAGLLSSRRGADGGYRLALAPQEISLASIVAALQKPANASRRARRQTVPDGGPANNLDSVWLAVHEGFRSILASMALSDVVEGRLFAAWTPTPPS